jgi:putative tricarboxylic transport membrane protein
MDRRRFLGLTAASTFVTGSGRGLAQAPAYPVKPINIVTHSQPGAVMDVIARLIVDIAQQEKLIGQPLNVLNKPGAGGGTTFAYLMQKKGDPYTIMTMPLTNIINLPLMEKVPYSYKDFTAIANLVLDGSLLVVRTDSPCKTMDDLIDAARKAPGKLNMSTSSVISDSSMMARQIMRIKNVSWELVTFASVGESVLALLGGTVDIGFASPQFVVEHIRAGKLRPLMTGAPQRYPDILNVPTITELGLGEPRTSYRGFFGPPQMPSYAVEKLAETLKAAAATPRFRKFMDDNFMLDAWLGPKEYTDLMESQNALAVTDFADMPK